MAEDSNQMDEKELEKKRNDANNTKNVRNAADVAIASGHPVGVAAGGVVKAADKVTGGKASETLGKGLTAANKFVPGGNQFQRASNQLSESGISDAAGKTASMKNSMDNANQDHMNQNRTDASGKIDGEAKENSNDSGRGQDSSLPSSSDSSSKEEKKEKKEEEQTDDNAKMSGFGKFMTTLTIIQIVSFFVMPLVLVLIVVLIVGVSIFGVLGNFSDGFGISHVIGEEIEGLDDINAIEEEDQKFYDRINDVRLKLLKDGYVVDAYKVVATFHIFRNNDSKINYSKIKEKEIEFVAMAQFDESGISSEEAFRYNMVNTVIPKYFPKFTTKEKDEMVDDILEYIENYYMLIGKDASNSLCNTGSGICNYDIKGYHIAGKGDIAQNMQISNLYVRIMQCGNTTQPFLEEELIPFEKYVLGVTYAAMDDTTPGEAMKASLVVYRNYLIGHHLAASNDWGTLKKESNKYVLQVTSCKQGRIYCDPDMGCSASSDGQIHSGLNYTGDYSKKPLSASSPLRQYATMVEGELLQNSRGYTIYAIPSDTTKQSFTTLAKKGLNYKQILMQYYNQGQFNYGASDIVQSSCSNNNSKVDCISTGKFAQWKQTDPAWSNVPVGNSGRTVGQIGCLATSVTMLIAKSGVNTTVSPINPKTFVEYLNKNGGFSSDGNFIWSAATKVAPSFQYQGMISVAGMSQDQKLAKIRELAGVRGVYIVAEVMGNTGQHWVAIDSVSGNKIHMMDPGNKTGGDDMWSRYGWANTSALAYYRVG